MDRELTRAELDELLPLYALDALEGEERDQVARYVERDAAASAEVDSLREAASFLPHVPQIAPADLWQGIEGALHAPAAATTVRPLPSPVARRRSSHRARGLAVATAVVVLLAVSVIAVLGVRVAHQQDRIDALASEMHHDTMTKQAEMAKAVPGAHSAVLASDAGAHSAQVVMLPDGSGFFMHSDLAALPSGRTYQLWAQVDDGVGGTRYVSVGVLGRDPSTSAFRVVAPVSGFLVSEEPTTGARAPGTMVLTGSMA